VRRLRKLRGSVGAGVLLAAMLAAASHAQTDPPSLGGLRSGINDGTGPAARKRSANTKRAAGAGQIGAGAIYGTPPGSGAGATGYLSTNAPAKKAAAKGAKARAAGLTSAATNGDSRPPRPGSPNTGPSRPGASISVPAGTATPLIRRRRVSEEDPFDALGIRVGSFVLRPAIETTAGYDTNPGRSQGGRGSSFVTVAPEFKLRSDWSRHALNAEIRGAYTAYESSPSVNQPTLDGRVNGRIDITRQTRADLEARTYVSTTSPNSPDLPAGAKSLPLYRTIGGTAGVTQQFNRFEVALKGSIDRTTYDDAELADGSTISQRDRNYNQYAAQLRVAYELTPGLKPFAEAGYDKRIRDTAVDSFGVRRDSDGTTARLGTTFEFSRKLTGEVSFGYLMRKYEDPTLPELRGLIADASLIYTFSGLTTAKLTMKSTADESTLPGVSGVLRRDVGLQVDHAFRRWLIGTARVGWGRDDYDGSTRRDERYVAALGVTYKATRIVHIKGEVRQEWLRSSIPGSDYTATVILAGMRLQR
jgi:hypothetical protein